MCPSSAEREIALKKAPYRRITLDINPRNTGNTNAILPSTMAIMMQRIHRTSDPAMFAHFLDDIMKDLPVPEHILKVTIEYRWKLSAIYEGQEQWTATLRLLLEDALGIMSKPDGVYEAELRGSKNKGDSCPLGAQE
jgi:hypothetical protein